ncbi:MAG: dienelactone hydrolase family protein [Gemmatimonadota bacterium]|nr:dienelactone hydrolase family protein [Gemmatimonadota bacterium]
MILVHGRGAGPANIMELSGPLAHPSFTYLAPAASGGTWYPNSFMAEIASNEPGLSSGLSVLAGLLSEIEAAGVPRGRTILAGFSQGACLTCEFLVRHPARYGAVLAFSGGLIGPPGTQWDTTGQLGGTPIFLGCSDVDAHVPKTRVDETADVFRSMGASVEKRIYPGMGHLINEDELAFARILVEAVMDQDGGSAKAVM